MNKGTSVKAEIGGKDVTITTGHMALQAGGSVTVQCGETIVLVAATAKKEPTLGQDFFPLTVLYQEKTFAAGKIPGGFFKREGRPTEQETLTGRLTDRPLRPLFPKTFTNETQIIITVLSADGENDADTLSIIGASAALMLSSIPFHGPIAGIRVGRVNGEFKANPTPEEIDAGDIDLLVAANKDSVVMVEGGAKIVSEDALVAAIYFAHKAMKPLFDIQNDLVKKCGKEKWSVPEEVVDHDLIKKVRSETEKHISKALTITSKQDRYSAFDDIVKDAVEKLTTEENVSEQAPKIKEIIGDIKKELARKMILKGNRIDGRKSTEIRQITCDVGLLPRVHGSALFTRGETQVLSAATLGTADDQQRVDNITGEYMKRFMLHYNFPPYSVGEVKRMGGVSRREVGHGALAERSVTKILPNVEDCPYTIRIVSEVLGSNGSSSMATVCASSLSLMDAGINIKAPVAGIAMGLIKEGNEYVVLSDILGDEDHLGDMDFKVTGTKDGVAAVQMDIKIDGISEEILTKALLQAKEGRLHILGEMNKCLSEARADISKYAPKLVGIKIDKERIKDLIGSGGKTINKIIQLTGCKINVDDEGNVQISCIEREGADRAVKMAKAVTSKVEVGKYYKGTVERILEFGAIVRFLPNADGMVHISELADHRVARVEDIVKEGDEVVVMVIDVDRQANRIKLSMREAVGHETEVEDVMIF